MNFTWEYLIWSILRLTHSIKPTSETNVLSHKLAARGLIKDIITIFSSSIHSSPTKSNFKGGFLESYNTKTTHKIAKAFTESIIYFMNYINITF